MANIHGAKYDKMRGQNCVHGSCMRTLMYRIWIPVYHPTLPRCVYAPPRLAAITIVAIWLLVMLTVL